MRYAFGLGGLLITLGVIVFIMRSELDYDAAALDAQKKAVPQINQMSGKAADGTPAAQSASLQSQFDDSNKLKGLFALDVVPGGVYESHFGLKQYDLIIQVGPFDVRTLDEGMARTQLDDAYARNDTIVVLRNKERVTLPLPPGATATATPAPATPGAPATPPKNRGIQGQLDAIQNSIPTH